MASKKRRRPTGTKRRERTVREVLTAPRNARERAFARQWTAIGAQMKDYIEAVENAIRASAEDPFQPLIDAEADRRGIERGNDRELLVALIIERRRIGDRPIRSVHMKRGRLPGATKNPADIFRDVDSVRRQRKNHRDFIVVARG